MNFYKTLTIFSIILLLQLTNVTICNGQDNFWERFLNIFQKEEPYARVRGDDRIEFGDTAEIRWDIKNADKIHIKGIKQDIPSKGSIKLQPDSTPVRRSVSLRRIKRGHLAALLDEYKSPSVI